MPLPRSEALPVSPAPAHARRSRDRRSRGSAVSWVGSHQASTPLASAATPPLRAQVAAGDAEADSEADGRAVPERLLIGGSLLRHTFSPPLRVRGGARGREDRSRPLGTARARAAACRLDDEDHDRASCDAEAQAARHRDGRQVGSARPTRARRTARRRARPGVEALLFAPPLLGQRRRACARDRGRRRQVDVHPLDECRGEEAGAPRHALLDAERRHGRGQLLERVGSRRADARRDAEHALPSRSCERASSMSSWSPPTFAKIYVNNNRLLDDVSGRQRRQDRATRTSPARASSRRPRAAASRSIAVVLNSPNMYADTTRLLDFGFASLS